MSSGSVYGPRGHDAMFADSVRTPAYLEAIGRVVREGDVVVEVGTGVGYFAVAACRAGARRVYAIEREPAVALAERLAEQNGCSDRIVCIRGDSRRIELPERGTVLVSDLRGTLPLFGDAIPTLVDARDRLLVPGARLIPLRDVIVAAPCTAPAYWAKVELALGDVASGIARQPVAAYQHSVFHHDRLVGELCAEPAVVVALDYESITAPDVDASVVWIVTRRARLEGIGLWFDAELAAGMGFTTAPSGPWTVHGQGFLPFERAIDAVPGDRLDCRLRATLVDGEYVFAWDTTVTRARGAEPPETMRQSTLGALLASPAELARRQASFRPDPAAWSLEREMLNLIDGRTLAEVGTALARAHPGRFASERAALAWVTRRYAQIVEAGDP